MSPVNKSNKVVVQLKDTKEVLLLAIALGLAIKKTAENAKFDYADIATYLLIVPKIGPAFEGIENVKLELANATKEDAENLKFWVNEQVELPEDKTVENFIEDAFAIVIDLWIFLNRYLLSGAMAEKNVAPKANGPLGGVNLKSADLKQDDEEGPIEGNPYAATMEAQSSPSMSKS